MPSIDTLDAHVRELSADDIDAVRPLARRHGFRPTTSDVLRFAVRLAAALRRHANAEGTVEGLPEDFSWPENVRRKPDWLDKLQMKRRSPVDYDDDEQRSASAPAEIVGVEAKV